MRQFMFSFALINLRKAFSYLSTAYSSYEQIIRKTGFLNLGQVTSVGEGKHWIQKSLTPKKLNLCNILPTVEGLDKYKHHLLLG